MIPRRILIKLGGAALIDPETRKAVTETLHTYKKLGHKIILVHGGGPTINKELTLRGIDWSFSNGQRVTTPEMMDVIEYALCGIVNRSLVRHFGAHDLEVVGVSGSDRQTLICSQASPELGQVGKIDSVNASWIEDILARSGLPVVAPVGMGQKGEAYNINADWAASHLAVALKVNELIFMTDQPGILDTQGQLIANVNADQLNSMIETKVVSGGMLIKTTAILHALKNRVQFVRVTNSRGGNPLSALGLTGTLCELRTTHKLENKNPSVGEVNHVHA